MNIVLFEDSRVSQLAPLAILRPMYTVQCGALSLAELVSDLSTSICGSVRAHLQSIQTDYLGDATIDQARPTLCLNARLIPDSAILPGLRQLLAREDSFRIVDQGEVMAALLPAGSFRSQQEDIVARLGQPDLRDGTNDLGLRLFTFPHEVIATHTRIMPSNLQQRLASGEYQEISTGVFAKGDVKLSKQTAFDVGQGPVLLEAGVTLEPFTVIRGPAFIGAHSTVMPHSFLKGNVAIGAGCKIGGEVSQTTVEANSNKAHFGYLGASYVGQWVNLGAGTTNSNLKNTYGTVRVEYDDGKVDTGLQFCGCIVGDYSKTAIHTSIYTGKIVGICSNVYGVVTRNVPSFANYAQSIGDVTEHPASVVEATQRRVFARRGITQRPCDVQLLRDAYELEAPKRHLADKPPSL